MNELIALIEQLSSWEITVTEQARTEENIPELQWNSFFPERDVRSVRLADVTVVDLRYISDRREWNADGRLIPAKVPGVREFEMVPMESYFRIDEREMQFLFEQNGGQMDLVVQSAKADIESRSSSLYDSILWGLEYEAFQGWANNEFIVQNPQTGKSYVASMQVDSTRYVTAGTPWTDENAYDLFLESAYKAWEKVGTIQGAKMRRSTAFNIMKSAPRLTTSKVRMTLREINERLSDELGTQFTIDIDERVVERFDGAGVETTPTKIWPAGKVGFIPAGGQIGNMLKAPQVRSQMLPQVASEFVDRNGIILYFDKENNGKSLKVQAQANWMAIPNEQKVYVVDAGN